MNNSPLKTSGDWNSRQRLPVSERIPATKKQRNQLVQHIREYVKKHELIPPLSFDELRNHSTRLIKKISSDLKFNDFTSLLLNNETWKNRIAGIPFNKRLLLLPKCLRIEEVCPAEFDTIGLVCKRCSACPLGDILNEAERLGYACMVAEGSPVVMSLIETGKVEAIIGSSCMSVLENVFPYMEAGAVPGIAIPLLNAGCRDTNIDLDWLWDAIHLSSSEETASLDIESLRTQVKSWFSYDSLQKIMGDAESDTEKIAYSWLVKAGKRWRPLLTACIYQALQKDLKAELPYDLKKIAVAVECFHKASLIHDDIEDEDELRYGEKTLHKEYGTPVAINIGDFLLGEGYRLIAESDSPGEIKVPMLQVVAHGHRTLSIGQGAELNWVRDPGTLSPFEVIDIFRKKTAPAFEVALRLGAIYANAGDVINRALKQYSKAIGIAYQIRDDIDDFSADAEASDILSARPSVLLSLAYEKANDKGKKEIQSIWSGDMKATVDSKNIDRLIATLNIKEEALELLENYKNEAVRSLCIIENTHLKGLLRRLIGKIFNEIETMGCCDEYQAGNASEDEQGPGAVA